MARGPSFNNNVTIRSLNNVDIYHIACRILKLQPNPYATAGSLNNLTSIFRTTEGPGPSPNNGCCLYSISSFSMLFMFFLFSFSF